MVNKKNLVLSLISLCLITFIGISFKFHNQIKTFAQTPTEPTPPESGLNCSLIGNNTASQLVNALHKETELKEAEHLLVSFQGGDAAFVAYQVGHFVNTIKNNPTVEVIIRLGAGGGDMGPDEATYIQAIKDINTGVGGLPFTVMVSHNEWNCAEHPTTPPDLTNLGQTSFDDEIAFATTVTGQLNPLENITLISGQVDHLCGYDQYYPKDKKSPQEYVSSFATIPGIDGISLPFYTADASPGDDPGTALAMFANAVSWANGKDIYITESGPFKVGSATPSEDEVRNYITGIQGVIQTTTNLKALMLFNALGINTEANFSYTSLFWSDMCRYALRTWCGDTDKVLEYCKGIVVDTGDHLCRDYCVGDANYPCRQTPGNDCSYPIDFDKLLDPKYTLVEGEEAPKEYGISLGYLLAYLPKTRAGSGKTYKFNANFENGSLCEGEITGEDANGNPTVTYTNPNNVPPFILDSLCQNLSGSGAVQFDLGNQEISGITPPNSNDSYLLRNQWATGFYSNRIVDRDKKATNKFEFGLGDKLQFEDQRLTKISAILALKAECHSDGFRPITEYKNNKIFGEVRCMNYMQNPNIIVNGTPINEKDLFDDVYAWGLSNTKLRPCRDIYYNPTKNNLKRCKSGLDQLYEQNEDVWKWVDSFPNEPKATFAKFGAIDEYAGEFETDEDTVNTRLPHAPVQGDTILNLNKENSECEDLGCLGTSYYIAYPLPAGQDTEIAARTTISTLLFPKAISQSEAITEQLYNVVGNILQDLADIVGFFLISTKPFNFSRIPVAQKADHRYWAVQYAFSKQYDACQQFLKKNEVDYSTNVAELNSKTTEDSVTYATDKNASLTSLINHLKAKIGGAVSEFTFSYFVQCEIFPIGLSIADEYAKTYAATFSNKGEENQRVLEKRSKRQFGGITTSTTQGQLDISNTASCECGPPLEGQVSRLPSCHIDTPEYPDGYLNPNCQVPEVGLNATINHKFDGTSNTAEVGSYPGGQTAVSAATHAQRNVTFPQYTCSLKAGVKHEFYCCSLEREGATSDPRGICPNLKKGKPPINDNVCSFNGGILDSISNQEMPNDLKSLLANKAREHNIPIELLVAVLQGENCRSKTLYGGETASICDADTTSPLLLFPHEKWRFTDGCDGGADSNPSVKGVLQLDTRFSDWVKRLGTGGDACSIYDSFDAAAKFFKEQKSFGTWSPLDMKKALLQWVLGNGSLSFDPARPGDCQGIQIDPKFGITKVPTSAYAYCYAIDEMTRGSSSSPDEWVKNLLPVTGLQCQE